MSGFLAEVDFARSPPLPKADEELLIALAALVVTCRSAVDRNTHTREIELVHAPERPARLIRVLGQLLRALQAIGVRRPRQRELIVKVGLDCIPIHRRLVLEPLLNSEAPMTTAEIAHGTKYSVSTIRRALEDLACHGILEHAESHSVTRRADTWKISPFWREQYRTARGAFPKCR